MTEPIQAIAPETRIESRQAFLIRYLNADCRIAEIWCEAPNQETALSAFRQTFRGCTHVKIRPADDAESSFRKQLDNLRRATARTDHA